MRLRAAGFALALLLAARLTAALPAGVPAQPAAPVTDLAGLFSPGAKAAVDQRLRGFWAEGQGKAQVAVLTLPSLEGRDIEGVSIEIARSWGLGRQGLDNGVLLSIAPSERRLRIEVGRHLEGVLTDIACSRIINDRMAPALRAGDPDEALRQGVEALLLVLDPPAGQEGAAAAFGQEDAPQPYPRRGNPLPGALGSLFRHFGGLSLLLLGALGVYSAFNWSEARADVARGLGLNTPPWNWPVIQVWLILMFLWLILRLWLRSGGRSRSSGGGGGSFGGFGGGGGGFSGGGASGKW